MSSEERDTVATSTVAVPAKKRRIQRACDACRQKRRACDGLRSSTRKCTYCIDNGLDCIYSGAPSTTQRQSSTEVLQARLAAAEKLLRKFTAEGHNSPPTTESSEWSKESPVSQPASSSGSSSGLGPAVELASMSIRAINEREPPRQLDEEELAEMQLIQTMSGLSLRGHGKDTFMGKSSGARLLMAAIAMKEQYISTAGQPPRSWDSMRKEYWMGKPWEVEVQRPHYTFPPPDLLSTLVDLYFQHVNMYNPLLHRPTFERELADDKHLRDDKFGALVLTMCAVASRFSDDPRAFDPAKPLTCGWKYFSQLSLQIEHLYSSPKLYDLQRYCLAIQFLEGAVQQGAWTLVGIGVRMAVEMGVHRRQTGAHTVEAELWRRAFWVLVSYDRILSLGLGRPCAMQYDDFDIQLPTECDDEYWEPEDPAQAFRQPPGKPSSITFFNSCIRLSNILAFVLHLLYSSSKAKNLYAAGDRVWDEHIVAELDSALNKWIDRIPEHLRWDPHRVDPLFFKQSVALYATYYHVQATAHRPFIPMVRSRPTTLPSLAICTNAARSCTHVIDVWYQRMKDSPTIILLPALTNASIILLLNVWSGKRTGLAPQMNSTINEVHKCMKVIRLLEGRWQMAGLFGDLLEELANMSQVPLPASTSTSAAKSSDGAAPPPVPTPVNQRKRAHTGYDDVRIDTQELETPYHLALPTGFEDTPHEWLGAMEGRNTLPMYGSDLGRLPVFPPPADYAFQAPALPEGMQYPDWAKAFDFPPSNSTIFTSEAFTQGGMSTEDVLSMIDNDAMAMWANAPITLETSDWGNYFSIMDGLSQEPKQ
ncbi:fungal-specific transcription factor domain-containing protein [Mycena galopus ATCC 62051]|nr:fungal-specific transcription factor domain-containing protein [Mycena galopus ATCC 62051]